MVRLALRSALSDRAADGNVLVVDDWGIERAEDQGRHRGRSRVSACAPRASARRACCSCSTATEDAVWKSFRNLGVRVQIVIPEELNAYDVLVNDYVVFSTRRCPAHVRRPADPSGA